MFYAQFSSHPCIQFQLLPTLACVTRFLSSDNLNRHCQLWIRIVYLERQWQESTSCNDFLLTVKQQMRYHFFWYLRTYLNCWMKEVGSVRGFVCLVSFLFQLSCLQCPAQNINIQEFDRIPQNCNNCVDCFSIQQKSA